MVMRKVIIGLLAMAAALSCTHKMDPYVGGDGLRANINSQKCVMRGSIFNLHKAVFKRHLDRPEGKPCKAVL